MADVPVERCGVGDLRAAVEAGAEVGRVVVAGAGGGDVVDAVVDDARRRVAPEVGDGGIVRVQDDGRRRSAVCCLLSAFARLLSALSPLLSPKRPLPRMRHGVDFAVAVELIAEEVGEDDDVGGDGARDLGQGRFIDLQNGEAMLGVGDGAGERRFFDEHRRDAAHEVRAAAVVERAEAGGGGDAAEHQRRRRLAVRAGDGDDARAGLRGQRAYEARIDAQRNEPGDRGAAAAAEQARCGRGGLAGGDSGDGARVHG